MTLAGMDPEQVGDELDTGANPGRHADASTASAEVALVQELPAVPVTATVEPEPTGVMHVPEASARRPRAAHVAMAWSCRVRALLLAAAAAAVLCVCARRVCIEAMVMAAALTLLARDNSVAIARC